MGSSSHTHSQAQSTTTFNHNHLQTKPNQPITMDSIKQGANYVAEKAQEATSGASKETNKQVAKDSDASIGTRASAAKDAIGDKAQEKKHGARARPTRRPSKLNHISTNNHELNGEEIWNCP